MNARRPQLNLQLPSQSGPLPPTLTALEPLEPRVRPLSCLTHWREGVGIIESLSTAMTGHRERIRIVKGSLLAVLRLSVGVRVGFRFLLRSEGSRRS